MPPDVEVLAGVVRGAMGEVDGFDENAAGHAEVDFEGGARHAGKLCDQGEVLADAEEVGDCRALEEGFRGGGEGEVLSALATGLGEVWPEEVSAGDDGAEEVRQEGAAEGLDFGKFGHGGRGLRGGAKGSRWGAGWGRLGRPLRVVWAGGYGGVVEGVWAGCRSRTRRDLGRYDTDDDA